MINPDYRTRLNRKTRLTDIICRHCLRATPCEERDIKHRKKCKLYESRKSTSKSRKAPGVKSVGSVQTQRWKSPGPAQEAIAAPPGASGAPS